jgi:hypothetical protein
VEAKDAAGSTVYAPKGYPCVTYSASVMPYPRPGLFITQRGALPKAGQDYAVLAMVIDRPANAKVRLRYRSASVGGAKGDFKTLPMQNFFYDSFGAVIPGLDLPPAGVEYFVEVEGEWWRKWTAPPEGEKGPQRDVPDMIPPGAVPDLKAEVSEPYEVTLSWSEAKDNVGLAGYEVYRGTSGTFPLGPDALIASTYKTHRYDTHVRAGETYWYVVRAVDNSENLSVTIESVSASIPKYPPPKSPVNVKAAAGRGKIKIAWDAMDLPVVGYNVYRAEAGGKPVLVNTRGPVNQAVYIDGGLKEKIAYTYTVRAVDRGGQEGAASVAVTAAPLPLIETPVFTAQFENSPDAESGLKGTLAGPAAYAPGVVGQALDLTSGGWISFKNNEVFDVNGEITLEAWVNFRSTEGMPVFLSHGEWRHNGFFVQVLGGRIRYSLGGLNDLDAGAIEPNKWYYVVCTYDMRQMRVYLNGREAGRREAPDVDLSPWVGPFYIGRYTLDGKPYEVTGLIDEVKIYQRARMAEEIKKEYESVAPNLAGAK